MQHLRRSHQPRCHIWSLRRWKHHSPTWNPLLDSSAPWFRGGLLAPKVLHSWHDNIRICDIFWSNSVECVCS
ncbi:unnamed protein product, partial [Vitis vinifera]